jgi:hypothetical protein
LLSQYIELAAKNDKWRDFNRGIEWTTYLGFKVRWLRQVEKTEEKLLFVFELMLGFLEPARFLHNVRIFALFLRTYSSPSAVLTFKA